MYESEKIKQAVKEAGLTQKEIAEKMGISQPAFNGFVSGKNRPTARTLKKIAEITGKDLSFFVPVSFCEKELKGEIDSLREEIELLKKEFSELKRRI